MTTERGSGACPFFGENNVSSECKADGIFCTRGSGGLAIKEVYCLVHHRPELVVDLPFDLEEMRTPWLSQYVLRPKRNSK